jgi:hypothetical protein
MYIYCVTCRAMKEIKHPPIPAAIETPRVAPCIHQHASACVSIRQHTSAHPAYVTAYVMIPTTHKKEGGEEHGTAIWN